MFIYKYNINGYLAYFSHDKYIQAIKGLIFITKNKFILKVHSLLL